MICVDYQCDRCIHRHEVLVDGWKPGCDAFPEGIPYELALSDDPKKMTDCNNGICYQPTEEKLEVSA